MFNEDDLKDTPGIVIAAIACGVAPVPFLVTYAAIFLLHGTIFPVDPPDITGSRVGEAFCGVLALAYLLLVIAGIGWFLSQRRRWFFVLFQLVSLGFALDFLLDTSKGDPEVPLLLVFTTVAATVLALLPASRQWVHDWREDDGAPAGRRTRDARWLGRRRATPTHRADVTPEGIDLTIPAGATPVSDSELN